MSRYSVTVNTADNGSIATTFDDASSAMRAFRLAGVALGADVSVDDFWTIPPYTGVYRCWGDDSKSVSVQKRMQK